MILKGLAFIHNNGFIFRDLNCGRINYESKSAHICIGDLIVSSEAFYNCFEEREHGI
jgi:serine/threonine protein kinase